MLRISKRTLERRAGGHLDPIQSDRFMRVKRIYDLAVETLGEDEAAAGWLEGLGGAFRRFAAASSRPAPDNSGRDSGRCVASACRGVDAGKSAILDVPSAVLPLERNLVVNPWHPDFKRIDTSHPGYPLHFDERVLAILEQRDLG